MIRSKKCRNHSARHRTNSKGMTLLETLIAVLMLVVFTGVVAMVMEFTFRFLGLSLACMNLKYEGV